MLLFLAAEEMNRIKENKLNLTNVNIPQPPYSIINDRQIACAEKALQIQEYINKMQYNHTGLFNVHLKNNIN